MIRYVGQLCFAIQQRKLIHRQRLEHLGFLRRVISKQHAIHQMRQSITELHLGKQCSLSDTDICWFMDSCCSFCGQCNDRTSPSDIMTLNENASLTFHEIVACCSLCFKIKGNQSIMIWLQAICNIACWKLSYQTVELQQYTLLKDQSSSAQIQAKVEEQWNLLKNIAQRNQMAFQLTKEEYLTLIDVDKRCSICGIPGHFVRLSLICILFDEGYRADNVRPCCMRCVRMKGAFKGRINELQDLCCRITMLSYE